MQDTQRKRALVLSGGGGRGAYHVGVLRFLEEHDWRPDVIVGTSIGAVNGAALASGHDSRSLWALWRRLRNRDVQKANLNPIGGHYFLDTSPLRETLQNDGWVDFGRLNSAEAGVHLRVTATEVQTGRLHVFGNSDDLYPSRMRREPLGLEHIIASCSIPLVYPATELNGRLYWDGATVANTPLSPAIDAGAEEIIVVIMTPWEDDEVAERDAPGGLLEAASTTLEWALLASFQADLKMFRRVNELVHMQVENARLKATNALLRQHLAGKLEHPAALVDADGDGIPDILQRDYKALPDPIIVAPRETIPVDRIIRYTSEGHERLYQMGYNDARRSWQRAGRVVEGVAIP